MAIDERRCFDHWNEVKDWHATWHHRCGLPWDHDGDHECEACGARRFGRRSMRAVK